MVTVLREGRRRPWIVLMLATLFVLVPLADTLVFGLHEHFADDGRDVAALHVGHLHSTAHAAHHCDLGMNPAHGPACPALRPPGSTPQAIRFERPGHATARPFLPHSPPRA